MPQVLPIPAGYHTATPYLTIKNCAKAIEFYKLAFGAVETVRMNGDNNKIMHAEIKIGDSILMMSDESIEMNHKGPEVLGGSPVSVLLYVENVDEIFKRAVSAGATVVREVKNEFYGDRMGTLRDPFGHTWFIGTHVEDVSPQEMEKRMKEMKH
ncbi:MAG: VOC family protein [Bacteriovorax sp.]|jgi:PhnB protein